MFEIAMFALIICALLSVPMIRDYLKEKDRDVSPEVAGATLSLILMRRSETGQVRVGDVLDELYQIKIYRTRHMPKRSKLREYVERVVRSMPNGDVSGEGEDLTWSAREVR